MPTTKKEETPGFCTATTLAELFNCTVAYVGHLRKDGIIKKQKTPAGDRYNVVASVQSYIAHLQEKNKGRAERPESEVKKGDAEARLKEAKAKMAEMALQELTGAMHRSEDVEAMTTDLVYAVRSALTALPGRLAVDVARCATAAEASAIIRREVNAVLTELSGYKYDPAKYKARVRERQNWEAEGGVDEEDTG